jgi:hypothetical protein
MARKQTRAKASIPPISLCIKYRAVKSSAGVPLGFADRHRLGVAQETVDKEPSREQVQHGGVSVCWPTWPSWPSSSSRRTRGTRLSRHSVLYVVPRVSLLGICWPERSNGSTRRPQPPWIPTSCMPPGCTKCKWQMQVHHRMRFCQSMSCPSRLFCVRLLHACAN